MDSLYLMAVAESENTVKVDSVPEKPLFNFSANGNMEGHFNIVNFYDKLYLLEFSKKKSVRIAYFSDSMTDGDFIVQDIRKQFQDKFGGKGVGFIGITSLSAISRYSVSHRYSENWQTYSFLKGSKWQNLFGIDGQASFSCDTLPSYVEYRANDVAHCEHLYNPVLFYGKSDNKNAYIRLALSGEKPSRKELYPTELLNTIILSPDTPKRARIEVCRACSVPFYGINSDDGKGVHVDNFSMRGNSGLPLAILNTDLLKSFDNALKYDLIILHYGANVLGHAATDYSWYEKKMTDVVNHLKECFQDADVIIVSTADKSRKQGVEMRTDKAVITLLSAQKKYAKATGSGFISLYNLMGGEGSMVKWVKEEKPSLANKDYTHFNANGSKKVASLIYKEIENGYFKYKKLKETGMID
jgi:lysophospholipase L1-like esterase